MSLKAIIDFGGHRYVGTSMRTHPPYDRIGSIPAAHLEEIGTGTRPRARCTNHGPADSNGPVPVPVPVARIDGVSTEIAIATFPEGAVYRREGAEIPASLTSAPWVQWRMSS